MEEYPDFEETCGYGSVTGILGANCRHMFHPFIPGVMERTYTDEQLANIDPPPFEYEGKTYTHYEATQKQREIERTIRKWKRREAAAANPEDKQAAQIRIRRLNQKYNEFSEAADLRTQSERMKAYIPNEKSVDIQPQPSIINNRDSVIQSGGKESGGHKYIVDHEASVRSQQAAQTYNRIVRENDIDRIARNVGLSTSDIATIKRHIFFDKHKLYDGYGRFEPDYDMAVAWKRLQSGDYLPRDITLLQHELLEAKVEREYNLSASEAHEIADEQYNWWEQLIAELGEGGEPDGLL